MKTLIEKCREGIVTDEIKKISKLENVDVNFLIEKISNGEIAILRRKDKEKFIGIGKNLKTKINVNIGTSSIGNVIDEIEKAKICEKYNVDTLCEMSMSNNIDEIRKEIFNVTSIPITTVPIYQAIAEKFTNGKDFKELSDIEILKTIEKHLKEGVSGIVLHLITKDMIKLFNKRKNFVEGMTIVSKGGALTLAYMIENNVENPFIENFDKILELLKNYDATLILGNTARAGSVCIEMDELQKQEMEINKKFAEIANKNGVQVIVEGLGGHIHIKNIEKYVKFYKENVKFPLFVAGPLPIDYAVGYDHIAACVGASIAAGAGADYLCCITPSEHISLPSVNDVREGIIAFKIAAEIGDAIKFNKIDERNKKISEARAKFNWTEQFRYSIDNGERAREILKANKKNLVDGVSCSMCGKYCAKKIVREYLKN